MSRHSPWHRGLPSGSAWDMGTFQGERVRKQEQRTKELKILHECILTGHHLSRDAPGAPGWLALQSAPHPSGDLDSWVCHTPCQVSRMCCAPCHSLCSPLCQDILPFSACSYPITSEIGFPSRCSHEVLSATLHLALQEPGLVLLRIDGGGWGLGG